MAEVEPKGCHLAFEADLLRLGEALGDPLRAHARLDQLDGVVHPLARLLVGAVLGGRGAPHAEGAVVAGAVAHERLDDVEVSLVPGRSQGSGKLWGCGGQAPAEVAFVGPTASGPNLENRLFAQAQVPVFRT